MRNSVSVLSTPTAETDGSSLILAFEDKRYLFGNVHEGLQRVCTQNGVRLGKLGNVFLTGKTEWRTTGGLMGLILTVADVMQNASDALKQSIQEAQEKWEVNRAKLQSPAAIQKFESTPQPKYKLNKVDVPGMDIHGGDNIMQILATARRFIFRKGLPLKVHEHADSVSTTTPTWEDHNIQVWAMPLRPYHHEQDRPVQSPRKRSFDDYSENEAAVAGEVVESRSQQLQRIMSDMFDSTWSLDALVETQLSEVKLPAMIFVRNPETKELTKYQGPMPNSGQDVPNIRVLVRKPWPGALIKKLPSTKPSPVSMSYLVRNHARRGRFNKDLAIKLGIEPGPAFSALAKGASIKTGDGRVITSEQVTGPMISGKGFAVVELPTADYIPSLKETAAFKSETTMEGIEAIFWLLGPGVTSTIAFQDLIAEHADRKHIISSSDHCANYLTMDAAAAAQLRHREIDEEHFDLLLYDNATKKLPQELPDCVIAHRGINLDLAPEIALSTTMEPGPLNVLDVIQKTSKAVKSLSRKAQDELNQPDHIDSYNNQKLFDGDAEIITLGTGSAVPSKQRNVSATLLRVPNVGTYLLDCGEGTLGQLARIYSPEELKEVLKDLKLIWISHMHADHHLGLTSVIKAWHTAVHGYLQNVQSNLDSPLDKLANPIKDLEEQQRLCIVSEFAMTSWLKDYSEIENFGYDKIVPLCVVPASFDVDDKILTPTKFEWKGLTMGFKTVNERINTVTRKITGLANLQAVYVTHCAGARAVSMTWPSGLKISYSGDCRPSKRFAVIGKDSTVLIHEATFDDLLSGDAKAKKHSTTREAIGVGLEMRAQRIILTHFSQRYSKLPTMENIVAKPIDFEDFTYGKSNNDPDTADTGPIDGFDDTHNDAKMSDISKSAVTAKEDPAATGPRLGHQPTPAELAILKDVKIGAAFDFMRIKIKDIITLEKYKAAFSKLYAEPEVPEEEAAAKQAEINAAKEKKAEIKRQRAEFHRQKQMAGSGGRARRESETKEAMQA